MDSTEKTAGGDLLAYLLTRTLHPLFVCLDDDEDDKFRCHGRRRFK